MRTGHVTRAAITERAGHVMSTATERDLNWKCMPNLTGPRRLAYLVDLHRGSGMLQHCQNHVATLQLRHCIQYSVPPLPRLHLCSQVLLKSRKPGQAGTRRLGPKKQEHLCGADGSSRHPTAPVDVTTSDYRPWTLDVPPRPQGDSGHSTKTNK